jgi:hypothetical protein
MDGTPLQEGVEDLHERRIGRCGHDHDGRGLACIGHELVVTTERFGFVGTEIDLFALELHVPALLLGAEERFRKVWHR